MRARLASGAPHKLKKVRFPYALSISHFVSSVGADAGFAALLGLAILVLLYFAHAREASTLRKQLAAATQRLEELETRAVAPAASPVAPRPTVSATAGAPAAPPVAPRPPIRAPSPAGAPGSAVQAGASSPVPLAAQASGAAGGLPGPGAASRVFAPPVAAPAGVGAPALNDATRVVPSTEHLVPDRGTSQADGLGQGGLGRTPSPVTAAAGGNGSTARVQIGGPVATRSLLEYGIPGHKRTARWLVSLIGAAVVAAVAVVLVLVLTGGSSHHRAVVHKSGPAIAAAPPGVVPGAVTVAVVNSTSVNQLAHHVGARLTRLGFKEGTLATATNQSRVTTAVAYLPGHRNDALAVAHVLKLPATVVGAASASTEGLVCPSVTTCTADVIVVAGSDLASKP